MAAVFYEPSTRTYASFLSAMQKQGGGIIPIVGVEYSSVSKGETFEDTIRTLGELAEVVVLRHPDVGSAARAADATNTPVINAGDGIGEHPTQALLDAYTIQRKLRGIDEKTITMVGDLKHGRTVHSLARLLTNYTSVRVNFVSPEELTISEELEVELSAAGLQFSSTDSLDKVLEESDAVYVTRIQKERFVCRDSEGAVLVDDSGKPLLDTPSYDAVKDHYIFNQEIMKNAKEDMILMHPLPRVNELSTDLDTDPRLVCFDQVRYGRAVRGALLSNVLMWRAEAPGKPIYPTTTLFAV